MAGEMTCGKIWSYATSERW